MWKRYPKIGMHNSTELEGKAWHACVLSHVWLFVTQWTLDPQAPFVHGIFQARLLECTAISFSRGSSWDRDWTCIYYVHLLQWQAGSLPAESPDRCYNIMRDKLLFRQIEVFPTGKITLHSKCIGREVTT